MRWLFVKGHHRFEIDSLDGVAIHAIRQIVQILVCNTHDGRESLIPLNLQESLLAEAE